MKNNRLNHQCLANNDGILRLQDCYYCIMYNLNDCTFSYNKTDSNGHVFRNNKTEFYIKNIESSESSKQTIKSYNYDRIDYSKELDSINSNSTISNDYNLNNILYDNYAYWSSKLMRFEHCKAVELSVNYINPSLALKMNL
jgi:hypothetical protein